MPPKKTRGRPRKNKSESKNHDAKEEDAKDDAKDDAKEDAKDDAIEDAIEHIGVLCKLQTPATPHLGQALLGAAEALPDILYQPLPPEQRFPVVGPLDLLQADGACERLHLEDDSDDKVRAPDQTFNECLIPSDDDDNILNQLRNSINDSSLYPTDTELQLALEMSMKENPYYNDNLQQLNEILILSKLEFEEHLKNKKEYRKHTLSNFYRKLQFLQFPNIIKELNEYFECNIDIIYLDNATYKNIFEIIDSYYKIPNEKGRKSAISEEEDNVLRNIFFIKD